MAARPSPAMAELLLWLRDHGAVSAATARHTPLGVGANLINRARSAGWIDAGNTTDESRTWFVTPEGLQAEARGRG